MTIAAIADIIRTHGAERPDAVALEVDGRSITFGELDARSSQAAQALRAAGVGPDDRVAFIDKNGAEWFEVTFGLAKLGAVNVVGQLAAGTGRDGADHRRRRRPRWSIVGPEFVEPRREDRGRARGGSHTVVAIGGHDRWPAYDDWVGGQPADDPGVRALR